MTGRVLGWGAIAAFAVAVSWLWPRIERAPTDYEIALEYLGDRRPDLALLFFRDTAWRGVAAYRAGRYAQASREFKVKETALSQYNLGNSQARLREWPEALATYEKVLRLDPNHLDARHNLALVKELLEPSKDAQEPEEAPEHVPTKEEEHMVSEPQEGISNWAQAADAPPNDTAGNTNDTDEVSESQDAERPKPVDTTGEVGSATAIGRTSEDRGRNDHRIVGTVDLKPRMSARPAEVLLRRIHDDPEKVVRARMLAVYESRIASPAP